MNKIYYKKSNLKLKKYILKFIGIGISCFGFIIALYVFAPLVLWQIFLAPVFTSQLIALPIPRSTFLTPASIKNLLASQTDYLFGVDYTNANNWFPTYKANANEPKISSYIISIPKIGVKNAVVSTVDVDLSRHLVNLQGTSTPPNNGNTVIFGHSTLPQLFNPSDYKTIFAYAHTLKINDEINVNLENITYLYKIFSITIVNPDDTSVLEQNQDDSYITLVTCTPPGTTWKRLIIKARLQKL